MPPVNSDNTMLSLCLAAFEALGEDADACRNMLKKDLGVTPGVYVGSGQTLLAEEMVRRLRYHLNLGWHKRSAREQ